MITARVDRFKLAEVFTIARGSRTEAEVVTVEITSGGVTGRGECVPYKRYGETSESVIDAVTGFGAYLEANAPDLAEWDSTYLARFLPHGAARNALDCAYWDLSAKQAGKRAWELWPSLSAPAPVTTAFTLSLDTPERMEAAAGRHAWRPLLKIKLGTPDDMPRLEAVRRGAPEADIIVDANEGWTAEVYTDLAPHLVRLGVKLVEQPLPATQDNILAEIERPLPVCADESCFTRGSLPNLVGKYDMINVKLDKAGGLTEALALHEEARAMGFGVMVGCMVGSSLAMAPAVLAAQGADIVDLDGPLLLAEDREPPLRYEGSTVYPPDAALWG